MRPRLFYFFQKVLLIFRKAKKKKVGCAALVVQLLSPIQTPYFFLAFAVGVHLAGKDATTGKLARKEESTRRAVEEGTSCKGKLLTMPDYSGW